MEFTAQITLSINLLPENIVKIAIARDENVARLFQVEEVMARLCSLQETKQAVSKDLAYLRTTPRQLNSDASLKQGDTSSRPSETDEKDKTKSTNLLSSSSSASLA